MPGVGEKTACKLIGEWGSVENLLANADKLKGKQKENIVNFQEQMMLSKKLATIELNVPVDFDEEKLVMEEPNRELLAEIFTEMQFTSLIKEMELTPTISFNLSKFILSSTSYIFTLAAILFPVTFFKYSSLIHFS